MTLRKKSSLKGRTFRGSGKNFQRFETRSLILHRERGGLRWLRRERRFVLKNSSMLREEAFYSSSSGGGEASRQQCLDSP